MADEALRVVPRTGGPVDGIPSGSKEQTGIVDVGNSINVLENSLRDLIELLLRKIYGESWFDHLGVTNQRIEIWTARRDKEPKRRPGGQIEQRLLYYADFYDVIEIIKNDWDSGFKDCFGERKLFEVYTDRLSAFRNPDAHSRALLPFEGHLSIGMAGQLRQSIALFLSTGAGGPEPEHFARIEEVRDSYGIRATGEATGGGYAKSQAVLRPGDTVSFVGRGWDPEGGALAWSTFLPARQKFIRLDGSEFEWEWPVEERDISEHPYISFSLKSSKPYHRFLENKDDRAAIHYRVLPLG